MTEPKSQLARICKAIGIEFRLHDLRRTFATHATIAGTSYELIQKALNHKSGSVTSSYIIGNINMMRPVFDTVFLAYSKMYLDIEDYERLVDPEGSQERRACDCPNPRRALPPIAPHRGASPRQAASDCPRPVCGEMSP